MHETDHVNGNIRVLSPGTSCKGLRHLGNERSFVSVEG